jgi:hypothetical protein
MDAEARNLIPLILANARLLFGRNQTYDVVSSQGPSQTTFHGDLPVASAYLIGYSNGPSNAVEHEHHKGRILKVVDTRGQGAGGHRVGDALEALGKWCREEVEKHKGSMAVGMEFEGVIV